MSLRQETPPLGQSLKRVTPPIRFSGSSQRAAPTSSELDELFDAIATGSFDTPLHTVFEQHIRPALQADHVCFFYDMPSVDLLYCPTNFAVCNYGTGLVSYAQHSNQIVIVECACDHVSYSPIYDGKITQTSSRVFLFPIFDRDSQVRAVVQAIRSASSPPFGEAEETVARYLQHKCRLYSNWLFHTRSSGAEMSQFVIATRLGQFAGQMSKRLGQFFNCRNGEVWELDRENSELRLFVPDSSNPLPVPIADGGVVGWSVQNLTMVSLVATQIHPAYNSRSDGKGESSLLVVPYADGATDRVYAVALRHKRVPNFFSPTDAQSLADLVPLVVASLNASEAVERSSQAHDDAVRSHKRMATLLQIAHHLSSQLHFEQLIVSIVDFARKLVDAERCAIFLMNDARDKFMTQLHLGLENAVEVPLATNIIGYVATTKQALNIKNAYGDPRFDRSSDITRGYRTYTLLAAPIFAENGDVYGVIEVVNKEDGVFTAEDEQLLELFNVFCRISIDNARMYAASVDLYLRLGECKKGSAGKKTAEVILRDSRRIVDAARAILYVRAGEDIETLAVDEDLELKRQRTKEQITGKHNMKKSLIRKMMNGPDADLMTMTPEEMEQNRLVQQVFDAGKSEVGPGMICSPIVAASQEVLGAMLMQMKKNREEGFNQVDLSLLEALCMFAAFLLEKGATESPG